MRVTRISALQIDNVHKDALRGLESGLEHLDFSANSLTKLPMSIFEDFSNLRDFRIQENMLDMKNYTFNGFRNSLSDLSILGTSMTFMPLKEIGSLRNLRSLGISQVKQSRDHLNLGEDVFAEMAPGLEELRYAS